MIPLAGLVLSSGARASGISGRDVLAHMLHGESEVAYIARETTTIWKQNPISSEQNVWKAGFKGKRIEYLKPAFLRGEIITDDGKQLHEFVARHRVVKVRASRLAQHKLRDRSLLSTLKNGKLQVRLIGRDTIAGRSAYVIEVRPKSSHSGHARKLWIDALKWVKLKTQDINSSGKVSSSSAFTSIRFVDSLPPKIFEGSFGQNLRIVKESSPQRFSSISEVQKFVSFRVMRPTHLPSGYSLMGIVVREYRQEKIVALRYSDGVNSFSLFQSPGRALNRNFVKRLLKGPVQPSSDTYTWRKRDLSLTLVGNLSESQFRRIAQSVR
jgi:hypothetical protein